MMKLDDKIYTGIIYVVRASLVFAFLRGVWNANWIIAFVSAVTLLLTYAHLFVEKRYRIYIPLELEIVAVVFIYASLFLGEVHGFYAKFWWWDLLLHAGSALAFGFIGFMIMYTLYHGHKVKANAFMIVLFSFCFAVSIGAVWEIFEFSMDQFLGLNMQKSGLVDTMWDLIVDVVGAAVASLIGYVYLKSGDAFFLGESMEEFKRDNPRLFTKKKKKRPLSKKNL